MKVLVRMLWIVGITSAFVLVSLSYRQAFTKTDVERLLEQKVGRMVTSPSDK
jgi:hypothetical protein